MGKPRGSIKKTLLGVMNDPTATPRDRIAASDRLARLRKGKPRGRHVKKETESPQAVEQQTAINATPQDIPQVADMSAGERYEALKAAGAPADERYKAFMEAVAEEQARLLANPEELKQRLAFWDTPEGKARAAEAYEAAIEVCHGQVVESKTGAVV